MAGERDIFHDSSAWQRLTSPSPSDWTPQTTRLKHDVTNVLQTMLAAIQELQAAHKDHVKLMMARDKQYDKLYTDLFDPREGAFATVRNYIDGKHYGLQRLGWTVLGGSIVASVMLVADLATRTH